MRKRVREKTAKVQKEKQPSGERRRWGKKERQQGKQKKRLYFTMHILSKKPDQKRRKVKWVRRMKLEKTGWKKERERQLSFTGTIKENGNRHRNRSKQTSLQREAARTFICQDGGSQVKAQSRTPIHRSELKGASQVQECDQLPKLTKRIGGAWKRGRNEKRVGRKCVGG